MRKSVVTKNKERDMTDELDQSTKDEWAGSVHNAIAYHDVADVPDPKGAPYVGLKKRNLLRKVGVYDLHIALQQNDVNILLDVLVTWILYDINKYLFV